MSVLDFLVNCYKIDALKFSYTLKKTFYSQFTVNY